jgi:hypothetical protein
LQGNNSLGDGAVLYVQQQTLLANSQSGLQALALTFLMMPSRNLSKMLGEMLEQLNFQIGFFYHGLLVTVVCQIV